MRGIILYFLILSTAFADDPPQTPQEIANEVFNTIGGGFTAESLANDFFTPMTSGAEMSTLDGTSTFTAQVSCNAHGEYLKVSILPAFLNDISALIEVDSDLDGNYEFNTTLNGVSAICQNGYMACTPGTMDDCSYHLIEANPLPEFRQLLLESDQSQLYGCFCFNDSCGTDLATTNGKSIVETMGTSISIAMANSNPRFLSSNIVSTNSTATFYGQDIISCSNTNATDLLENLSSAQGDDNAAYLLAAGQDAIDTQSDDSVYSILMDQQGHGLLPELEERSCTVTRELSYTTDDIIEYSAQFWMYAQGQSYVECEFSMVSGDINCSSNGDWEDGEVLGTLDYNEVCNEFSTSSMQRIGWFQHVNAWGRQDTSVSIQIIVLPNCSNGLTGKVRINDTMSNTNNAGVWLSGKFQVNVKKPICTLNETLDDQCSSMETSSCVIDNETSDTVTTMSDGFPTHLAPLPSSVTVSNADCSSVITRDWFAQERSYNCLTDNQSLDLDLSHLEDPVIVGNEGTITIGNTEYTLTVPEITLPTCQMVCTVESIVLDVQANNSGQTSDGRSDDTRIVSTIKACSSDTTCPLGVGEQISKPCGCESSFAEAAMTMQLLRLAGEDLICTSGEFTEQ